MSNSIHPPRVKKSGKLHLPDNTMHFYYPDDKTLITSEVWNNVIHPDVWNMPEGIITARNGYKWIHKWEEGKNYLITKTLDEKGLLVGVYIDISSPIQKDNDVFFLTDWYLDIWQLPGEDPTFLDEDELELATNAGYLTRDESKLAKELGKFLKSALQKGELLDF